MGDGAERGGGRKPVRNILYKGGGGIQPATIEIPVQQTVEDKGMMKTDSYGCRSRRRYSRRRL